MTRGQADAARAITFTSQERQALRRALRLVCEMDLDAGPATLGIGRHEWAAARAAMRKLRGPDPGPYPADAA